MDIDTPARSRRHALCNSVDASDPQYILASESPANVDMEDHSPPSHVYDVGTHCEVLFAPGTPLYTAIGDAIMAVVKQAHDPITSSKITGMIIDAFSRSGTSAVTRLLHLTKEPARIMEEAGKCLRVLHEQRQTLVMTLEHRVRQRVMLRNWPQRFAERVCNQLLSIHVSRGDEGLDELSVVVEDPLRLDRAIDAIAREVAALGSPTAPTPISTSPGSLGTSAMPPVLGRPL